MTTPQVSAAPPSAEVPPEGLSLPAPTGETLSLGNSNDLAGATLETPATSETPVTPLSDKPTFAPEMLDDLDDEALLALPRFKGLSERQANDARQRAETAAEQRLNSQRSEWYQKAGYIADIKTHIASALANNGQLDDAQIENVAEAMWRANSQDSYTAIDTVLTANLPDDITFTRAEIENIERTRNDVIAGRKPLQALIDARWQQSIKAYTEKTLRPSLKAEIRKEMEAEAQTNGLRTNSETRSQTPAPTVGAVEVAGSTPTVYRTQNEVRAAHARGDIPNSTMRDWRDSGRLARLPLS